VVANYRYDAYGAIISVTDANGNYVSSATHIANLNPFRYRGYMYDEESGFYYLRSRYYEPYIGRFLNADALVSTGQGFDGNNMFAYCGNNPVNRRDASGLAWELTTDALIHNAVLDHLCKEYPELSWKKTYIKHKNSLKRGFCDLFNTDTGEVWELKKDSDSRSCLTKNATTQLEGYLSGYLGHYPSLTLKKPYCTTINRGKFLHKLGDKTYEVEYWDEGNGILRYKYYELEQIGCEESVISTSELGAHSLISAVIAIVGLALTFLSGGTVVTVG